MLARPPVQTTRLLLSSDRGLVESDSIQAVQERHLDWLMCVPGVVGVGIGECDDTPCIKILASELTREIADQIPSMLDGYPVAVDIAGGFHALGTAR
jgi:hypothetical protein